MNDGYEIGIDIGGTFTDVVCRHGGDLRLVKIPTTRSKPSLAVNQAVRAMIDDWGVNAADVVRFAHGTTVATNAVLERKGAEAGILTTEGFKDVLELGRQNRHKVYDLVLEPETPWFLAPGARRREVVERLSATGEVLTPLDEASLAKAVEELVAAGVEAIAICFLFSFLNPEHEQRARDFIVEHYPHVATSLSSEVDPSFREYERTCVTTFDAYVKAVVDTYLQEMEDDLKGFGIGAPLQVMQSRGGLATAGIARDRPVRLFLSGPAGGVIGGCAASRASGIDDLITVDIGGTSTDIALVSGGTPLIRQEGLIAGYSVRVPMVDVNTLGAGGGSIAWLDGAGGLRVGPNSAGSEPGPACYGRGGEEPTVTDASVVLGYLNPEYFAGGALALDPAKARAAIEERIAGPMGFSVEDAALGIHRVVNAQMAEGIRLVSIKRGLDPRGFTLVPLGGAGALHATALARDLGIDNILVPRHPGVLSAIGLLAARIEHEVSMAFPRRIDDIAMDDVRTALQSLDERCTGLMRAEGVEPGDADVAYFADVCYVGQAYHLEIPFFPDDATPLERLYGDFCDTHDRVHGHSTQAPARIVNLRSIHSAGGNNIDPGGGGGGGTLAKGTRTVLIDGFPDPLEAQIAERSGMAVGTRIPGPAVIEQSDTTTLVPPGWTALAVDGGNLSITRDEE